MPHFNSNRTGNVLKRSMQKGSVCLVISMYGCGIACSLAKGAGRVSPSSRFRGLGEVVTTMNNGKHHVGIVVPFLCRDHRRGEASHRSLSYTLTLRRLIHVNMSGVVAFSTRSPHMSGTVPLDKFRAVSPACRFVGNLLHGMGSLRVSDRRVVTVDPSRNNAGHTMCLTGILNLSVNVFCGHHSCARVMGKHGPVITRRFLKDSMRNGSMVVVSSVVSSKSDVVRITARLGEHGTGHVFTTTAFNLFAGKVRGFSGTCRRNVVGNVLAAGLVCRAPGLLSGPCCVGYSVDGCVTLVVSALGRSKSLDRVLDPGRHVRGMLRGCGGKRTVWVWV